MIDMTSSEEESRIKDTIKRFKSQYPSAVAKGKDKNLIGFFLERLTSLASNFMGIIDYDGTTKPGDRGVDIKLMDESFQEPLLIAVECMNGRHDYTDIYLGNLKARLATAIQEHHVPLIICVNKKTNFQRFKGPFPFKAYFIELRKQYHPNTTKYKDYLTLKSKLRDTINDIARAEKPEEMAERDFEAYERERTEEAQKAFEQWEQEENDRLLERIEEYEEE
jgi:Skp family chaperone for outer membrane proteins